MFLTADEFAAKMTAPVILLCFFLAFCPLSVGTPLTCPPLFLNESAQQGSGRLCATLQLQTKLSCPSVNLSVRENEKLNPEKWHLESLSLKVEKACSFMVFKQDKQHQHFPGGFYANIPKNSINKQSEFLCICTKLHIRYKRTTPEDFKNRHLVDEHADQLDKNYWQDKWDKAANIRLNVPTTQSFMVTKDFETLKFNFPIIVYDKTPNAYRSKSKLFRSDRKIFIYDVSNTKESGLTVERRHDYVVVALKNGKPVHFEQAKDIAEHLEKMKSGETLNVKKVLKGNKAVLEIMADIETITGIAKGTTQDVIKAINSFGESTAIAVNSAMDQIRVITTRKRASKYAIQERAPNPAIRVRAPNPAIGERAPNPAIGERAPNPAIGERAPNPAIGERAPNPAIGERAPNPAIQERAPNPAIRVRAPNPAIGERAPNPAIGERAPNPAIGERAPNPAIQERAPKPAIQEWAPKPAIGEGAPNPAIGGGGGAGETAIGGGAVETAIGGAAAETAIGGAAAETVIGGGAAETAIGGAAAETAIGGAAAETVIGGGAVETMIVGGAAETAIRGGAAETAIGGGAGETAIGGAAAETAIGDAAAETVIRGGAAETVIGGIIVHEGWKGKCLMFRCA
ncbi:uncharacterized protein LOC127509591 isoform X2 [Ctenopharyngodon idella]|uniref:uncharacterized protein LOC127509591 isoform X2 n=1 Tax=Ctenopharyngodon idella TaxID=7959 RepID=UPI00222FCC8C|nr:uncharacterized protein LOC127509591 isoform X2 [Ctenopharyngodon idella]